MRFFNHVSNLPKNVYNNDNNNYQAFIKTSLEKTVIKIINCAVISI